MEDWLFFSISLSFSLIIFVLLSAFLTPKTSRAPPLPPGPRPIPILGPILFLGRTAFHLAPLLRGFRLKYGPVFSICVSSRPAIFISSHAATHRALVQSGATFADRPNPNTAGRVMTPGQCNINSAPYGPLWRALRRNLTAEILHPSRIRHFSDARRWVLDVLIEDLKSQSSKGGGTVVAMESFRFAMFCLLVLMCFGERLEETKIREIENVQQTILSSFASFQVFSFYPMITKLLFRKRWNKLLSLRKKQEEIFIPLIRARKEKNERQGFVHSYVDSLLDLKIPKDGGRRLEEGEMVSLCSEFLNAGTDTTATTLQWIMASLVKNPQIQANLWIKIQEAVGVDSEEVKEEDLQKLEYLKAVVLEGLRVHPPGHFVLPHTVTEDTELDGYQIPRGCVINFMVAEMGRDNEVWTDPMEFKPERFMEGGEGERVDLTGSREIKMMPFGVGRRICPGLGLALLHLEYFIANLIREFEWRKVDGEEVDLTEKFQFTVVMKNPLQAIVVPRKGN